jgi:uncharacterized protein with PIN domain
MSESKNKISIRFYEELNDLIDKDKRKIRFDYFYRGTPSVKDVIEALGVPHTEVDLILVNGKSVDFKYRVKSSDDISVYPVFESFDISDIQRLRPKPLRNIKFILDVHLGKLARLLRVCGFDTYYSNKSDDKEIIDISIKRNRTIITRDSGILKNNLVVHGYFVRSRNSDKQLEEVFRRFHLHSMMKPFSRCSLCNSKLKGVSKEKIESRLPLKVKEHFDEFVICGGCEKIYWKGSHFDKLKKMIQKLERPQ